MSAGSVAPVSVDSARRSAPWPRRSLHVVGLVVIASLLAALGGYLIGANNRTQWHEGPAFVGVRGVTAEADGWSYWIGWDVNWIDASGTRHSLSRPACLDAPVGETVQVRFAAVDVEAEGSSWREVIMVDCRD